VLARPLLPGTGAGVRLCKVHVTLMRNLTPAAVLASRAVSWCSQAMPPAELRKGCPCVCVCVCRVCSGCCSFVCLVVWRAVYAAATAAAWDRCWGDVVGDEKH
jgi:hypothetical protein